MGALLTGVVGSYLWLQADGGGGDSKKADAVRPVPDAGLGVALRYVSASVPFAAVIQTNVDRTSARAVLDLADRFPGAEEAITQIQSFVRGSTGIDLAGVLPQLLGNPVVVAGAADNVVASWLTNSAPALQGALTAAVGSGDLRAVGTYHSHGLYTALGGTAVASSGPVVVAGSSIDVVRLAIDRSRSPALAMTPARFEARAAGIPRSSLIRAVAVGPAVRRLISRVYAPSADIPWVSALSRGALGITAGAGGLHAVVKIDSAPGVLTATDLPIAAGSAAPVLTGFADVAVGIRDLSHLGDFVLAAGEATGAPLFTSYKEVDQLLTQFARIDLDQDVLSTLTGPATITTNDLQTFNLRATTTDPSGVEEVLDRIAGIGRIGGFLGVDLGGYGVESDGDGLVTITREGNPLVTLGIRGEAFVASTDPDADFDAIADAAERDGGTPPARGALRARVSPKALVGLLEQRLGLPAAFGEFLQPLGQAIVTARAAGGNITLQAFLPVG